MPFCPPERHPVRLVGDAFCVPLLIVLLAGFCPVVPVVGVDVDCATSAMLNAETSAPVRNAFFMAFLLNRKRQTCMRMDSSPKLL